MGHKRSRNRVPGSLGTENPVHVFRPQLPAGATRTSRIPDLPAHLLDEAHQLFNVRLNMTGDPFEKMQLAYAFMDKVNRHVTPHTSCTRGCSHCCHMDVHITTFEAEFICVNTGVPHVHQTPHRKGYRSACPFLAADGACGIYEYRPVLCRTYHSLSDPALCAVPNAEIVQYGSMKGGLGNILFQGAATWVHVQNQAFGEVKDIRDFFPHDRAQVQQHLAGRTSDA